MWLDAVREFRRRAQSFLGLRPRVVSNVKGLNRYMACLTDVCRMDYGAALDCQWSRIQARVARASCFDFTPDLHGQQTGVPGIFTERARPV